MVSYVCVNVDFPDHFLNVRPLTYYPVSFICVFIFMSIIHRYTVLISNTTLGALLYIAFRNCEKYVTLVVIIM
jgi:hypothetical protein